MNAANSADLSLTRGERLLLEAAAQARDSRFRLLRVEYGYITDLPRRDARHDGSAGLELAVRGLLSKRMLCRMGRHGEHWCFGVTETGASALRDPRAAGQATA